MLHRPKVPINAPVNLTMTEILFKLAWEESKPREVGQNVRWSNAKKKYRGFGPHPRAPLEVAHVEAASHVSYPDAERGAARTAKRCRKELYVQPRPYT